MIRLIATCCFMLHMCLAVAQPADKPNIIIITYDDMNDWVSNLQGQPQSLTPNLDSIAKLGTTFLNTFCNAPVCAPSRTSWLTGKSPHYTQVYNNEEYISEDFRENFPEDKQIITLPQYLKDSVGYYTVSMNKIFHAQQFKPDFDSTNIDACSRSLSWNDVVLTNNLGGILNAGDELNEDVKNFEWAMIDDSFTTRMKDYTVVDEAALLLDDYTTNPGNFCNKPLMLCVGFHKPHLELYIPEQFFLPFYIKDFYQEPYDFPYNYPSGTFPYNGLVLPPQPAEDYADYDSLGFVGQALAAKGFHDAFKDWADSMALLITINDTLTNNEREDILMKSKMANATMAYLAAINFGDAQLGRLWDALNSHPDFLNNSVIIITSDHGYSLDEKKHWKKNALWDTDIRVPFYVIDMRNKGERVVTTPAALMDIFPTICDYIGIQPPVDETGNTYTDGISLRNIASDTTLIIEKPVVTVYKAEEVKQAGCFEQYSVRNDRFHYIKYKSNNIDGDLSCDETQSVIEEELYELGTFREVDPNEWNNLIKDEQYQIVKTFFSQWLPDSILFNRVTYKPIITISNDDCPIGIGDTIGLTLILYDTTGFPINIPDDFSCNWHSNFNDVIQTGDTVYWALNDIATILSLDKLIFTLSVEDNTNGYMAGLDLMYFYPDGGENPSVDFTAAINIQSNTVAIDNILLPVDVDSVVWDYGDGFYYTGFSPPAHTYTSYGTFYITCFVYMSVGDKCVIKLLQSVETIDEEQIQDLFICFPNPTSAILYFATSETVTNGIVTISNLAGQELMHVQLADSHQRIIPIDVQSLAAGLYFITLTANDRQQVQQFIKH